MHGSADDADPHIMRAPLLLTMHRRGGQVQERMRGVQNTIKFQRFHPFSSSLVCFESKTRVK